MHFPLKSESCMQPIVSTFYCSNDFLSCTYRKKTLFTVKFCDQCCLDNLYKPVYFNQCGKEKIKQQALIECYLAKTCSNL